MRRISRTLPNLALAGLGALIVHQLGYLIASPPVSEALADHTYMPLLWAVVTPLGMVAAAILILRQVRDLGYRTTLGTRSFSILIGSAFLIQESIEALHATQSASAAAEVLFSPAILAGLLIAPLVATVLTRTLRRAAEVVLQFVQTKPAVAVPALPTRWYRANTNGLRLAVVSVAPSRGPPRHIR